MSEYIGVILEEDQPELDIMDRFNVMPPSTKKLVAYLTKEFNDSMKSIFTSEEIMDIMDFNDEEDIKDIIDSAIRHGFLFAEANSNRYRISRSKANTLVYMGIIDALEAKQ